MILGDLETETGALDQASLPNLPRHTKAKHGEGLIREDAEEIVRDPLNGVKHRARRPDPSLSSVGQPSGGEGKETSTHRERSEKLLRERSIRSNRRHKFVTVYPVRTSTLASYENLLGLAYHQTSAHGLATPPRLSSLTHRSASIHPCPETREYLSLVEVAFARDREGLDQPNMAHKLRSMYRGHVLVSGFGCTAPHNGVWNGSWINDLVTPSSKSFFPHISTRNLKDFDPALLPTSVLNAIEADSFWCLSRSSGRSGGTDRCSPSKSFGVTECGIHAIRVSVDELPTDAGNQCAKYHPHVDTYLAEGPDAFSQFHLYVCSAFLVRWSEKLRQMDFQGIIMFLQSLPTQDWGDHEIEMLLSEAFVLNSIWQNAQSHFNGKWKMPHV
ncbi:putative protein with domain in Tre-2, BUB2p, and Cdc16p [Lyophyllum shimeji]|uniref:Uncharacterized protein n=1 Tax=Lyophyllum shimeji TaxID=47721 RepID=A0A9P3ULT5_LYOSH|nr:putative protein with domain in Tre-2, BUB2p, and Cdc16p [Lyophyllum shimeji]